MIECLGLDVYVDWIEDSKLHRSKVTIKTAALLRERMKACSSLVYAHSANSSNSVWMPWELGYFDGIRPHQVWVLPLVTDYDTEFKIQEYLGLYPSVEKLSSLAGRTSASDLTMSRVTSTRCSWRRRPEGRAFTTDARTEQAMARRNLFRIRL
jgi:hypothetical protein